MKKLNVKLQNCHGIGAMEYLFDFSIRNAYAIYAPNGSMKSSFAKTLRDIAEGRSPVDNAYPHCDSTWSFKDENNAELGTKDFLVLFNYDDKLDSTENTSTLLLNEKLKQEYTILQAELDASKDALLTAIKKQSGSKKQIEIEISQTYKRTDDNFYGALASVITEVRDDKDPLFAKISYDVIFEEKVLAFLEESETQKLIQEYLSRYNELIATSVYFRRGVFEYYGANEIAESLAEHGFFDAKHAVVLNGNVAKIVRTKKELVDLISEELARITEDGTLKKSFQKLKKKLEKNPQLRSFFTYLVQNPLLVPHLANIDRLRFEIWVSYFKAHRSLFDALLLKREEVGPKMEKIEEQARKEQTIWEDVISLFNSRFIVPFKAVPENKVDVSLGSDKILKVRFIFDDGRGPAEFQKLELLKLLSQGEQKALYILNILFEVETRRKACQETLFVLDDIADSFDYKNKYAIIQYLKEIIETTNFRQIILTHNFDFFRTLLSRGVTVHDTCLMVFKNRNNEIRLEKAEGIRNVFVNVWKPAFFNDSKKRIASISFMRNLLELTQPTTHPAYLRLTSLLHWKPDTAGICQDDLDKIYHDLFYETGQSSNPRKAVVDLIHEEARDCLEAPDGINFEHKIVLSIAIRLAAEQFMVEKIDDASFWATLTENQTPKLLTAFIKKFASEIETTQTLKKVILMTPENIHLNSFMYEPILDMSDRSLRQLYEEVSRLRASA